jgi:hypothetical protein
MDPRTLDRAFRTFLAEAGVNPDSYPPSHELALLGSWNRGCPSPNEANDFARFVLSAPPTAAGFALPRARPEITFECRQEDAFRSYGWPLLEVLSLSQALVITQRQSTVVLALFPGRDLPGETRQQIEALARATGAPVLDGPRGKEAAAIRNTA